MGNGGQNRSLRQLRSPRRWRQQVGGWSGVSSSSRHTHPGDAGPVSHTSTHSHTDTRFSHTASVSHTLHYTRSLSHIGPSPHTASHTDGLVHTASHARPHSVMPATHRNTLTSSLLHTPRISLSPSHTNTHTASLLHIQSLSHIRTLSHAVSFSHTKSIPQNTQNLSLSHSHRISLIQRLTESLSHSLNTHTHTHTHTPRVSLIWSFSHA